MCAYRYDSLEFSYKWIVSERNFYQYGKQRLNISYNINQSVYYGLKEVRFQFAGVYYMQYHKTQINREK
jgi:hypothetical protein